MRFASLGSGSRGNCLIVESGKTRILVDAGFGPREIQRRLARLDVSVDSVDAVLVTHEHTDHVGGAFACAARYGWIVKLTGGTLVATRGTSASGPVEIIDSHCRFEVNAIAVEPYPVPHDAREPVQFVLSDGDVRLGVLTDAGHVTRHMADMLDDCDALVLECNHDLDMLASGTYPPALKRRISGSHGHLDNAAAAGLLSRMNTGRLRHVVAAHLSEQNNRPELARRALSTALNCAEDWIGVATQDQGFGWREI